MSISQGVSTVSKSIAITAIGSIESIGLWFSLSVTLSISIGAIAKTISMAITKMSITMSQRIRAVPKTISIESIGLSFWLSISITLSISIITMTITMAITKRRVAKIPITISMASKTITSISSIESIGISLWLSLSFTLSISIISMTISMAITKRRVS